MEVFEEAKGVAIGDGRAAEWQVACNIALNALAILLHLVLEVRSGAMRKKRQRGLEGAGGERDVPIGLKAPEQIRKASAGAV